MTERTPRLPRFLLGPGLLLAATSIGGSHLLMASRAGAEHGFALLWLLVFVHLVKLPIFECGPRYALATGDSLLAAYANVPGPRHWALWVGLFDLAIESVGVIAAVTQLAAAMLAAFFGGLSVELWALVVAGTSIALLATGGYVYLRRLSLAMIAFLLVGTLLAFAASHPDLANLRHVFQPELPRNAINPSAAILGWMPTALGVSVWHSMWILADERFHVPGLSTRDRTRLGLLDMRVGYVLSLVIAFCFLFLGASLLHADGERANLPEQGAPLAAKLATMYTNHLGAWAGPVFLWLAFFAMFSSVYASMDGFPRTFLAVRHLLRGEERMPIEPRGYWIFLVTVTVLAWLLIVALPSPLVLFTVLAGVTFVLSPVYAWLNVLVLRHRLPDEVRPGRAYLHGATLCAILLTLTPLAFVLWRFLAV